jgi:hypothetical protein
MDGHPRQNPAYRPATEKALETGLFPFQKPAQYRACAAVRFGVRSASMQFASSTGSFAFPGHPTLGEEAPAT